VVSDLKRGFHGAGGYLERLNHERPDKQRDDNRDQNRFDIFPETAAFEGIAVDNRRFSVSNPQFAFLKFV